jgi:ATP-dependent DNA ligase
MPDHPLVTIVRPAAGFIEPCLPTVATLPPAGPDWVHEIKHRGYRLMVRRSGDDVRVHTRRGADWTKRFPRVVEGVMQLQVSSVLLDGEGAVCDERGMGVFDEIHSKANGQSVIFYAFDILELNGEDLRELGLLERKKRLRQLLARSNDAIFYNEHFEEEGAMVFEHACKLGCEGIVAKRIGAPYRSGRSTSWIKIKNPNAAAVRPVKEGSF